MADQIIITKNDDGTFAVEAEVTKTETFTFPTLDEVLNKIKELETPAV